MANVQIPSFEQYKKDHPQLASMYNDALLHSFYNQHVTWLQSPAGQAANTPGPNTNGSNNGSGSGNGSNGWQTAISGVGAAGTIAQGVGTLRAANAASAANAANAAANGATSAAGTAKTGVMSRIGSKFVSFKNWLGWGSKGGATGTGAGGALAVVANVAIAGVAAVGLMNGIWQMTHGNFNAGTLIQSVASAAVLYYALAALSVPGAGWIVAGVAVVGLVIGRLWRRIFPRRAPNNPNEARQEEMPTTVFTAAPVVMLLSGMAMSFMGLNLNTAPAFMTIEVPGVVADAGIAAGVSGGSIGQAVDINGNAMAPEARRDVFVYQGDADGHTDTRVVYFKPGANGALVANILTLPKGMTFKQGDQAKGVPYIPLFGADGKPTPQAVQALDVQGAMLRASQSVDPRKSWDALRASNAANHGNGN